MNFLVRKSGYILLLAIILTCATIAIRGPKGLPALMEKREQIRDLQEKNATLSAENQRKRERIQRLKTSRAEQELEIRQKLKMLRPGETQFILPETKPAQ